MSIDNRYDIRTDFLPRRGLIYVETSALKWVAKDEEWSLEKNKAELKKLSAFNKRFSDRGRVLTTPLVLAEIEHNIKYYRDAKKGEHEIKKSESRRKHGYRNMEKNSADYKLRLAKKSIREYSKVYAILEKGIESYVKKNRYISIDSVATFVRQFNKLSNAKKEIVVTATTSGHNNGILTANAQVMRAYCRSVKEFKFNGCFICNGIESKVNFI